MTLAPRPAPPDQPEPVDPARAAAPARTAGYLRDAAAAVDALFGEGYARDNPALVASLVQATAIEAAIAAGERAHGEALALARQISRETNETILKLKPRIFG